LWVQWHHGSTFRDEQQNNHSIKQRLRKEGVSACLLRKLCKGLATAAGFTDDSNPTAKQLNTLYGSNQTIRAEILPSQLTRTNRRRTREEEYTWKTVGREYEKRLKRVWTGEGRDQQQEETVEPSSQSQAVSTNREASMDSSTTNTNTTNTTQWQRLLAVCDENTDALKSIVSPMTYIRVLNNLGVASYLA
jgi:hypothetical protein